MATQVEIAKFTGFSQGYVSKVFNRKIIPNYDNAQRFAYVTGSNPVFWMDRKNSAEIVKGFVGAHAIIGVNRSGEKRCSVTKPSVSYS